MLGLSCGRQDLPSLLQQAGSFAARQIFSCGMRALGLLSSSADKETACNAEDPGLIPGFRRSPGEGNGNPLQFSCLENPMDRGAWWTTLRGVVRVGHNLATKLLPATTVSSELQPVGSNSLTRD